MSNLSTSFVRVATLDADKLAAVRVHVLGVLVPAVGRVEHFATGLTRKILLCR